MGRRMMKIERHKGVWVVEFGMRRSEVERAVGVTPQRRRRNEFSVAEYDRFDAPDMFVYYDAEDRAVAAEFGREAALDFEGYDLFGHPALAVRMWASQMDPQLDRQDGFRSVALGLSMYAPEIDDDDRDEEELLSPAEGFMVFKPGYYEEERRRIDALRAAEH
jgi:hypothetical protein